MLSLGTPRLNHLLVAIACSTNFNCRSADIRSYITACDVDYRYAVQLSIVRPPCTLFPQDMCRILGLAPKPVRTAGCEWAGRVFV